VVPEVCGLDSCHDLDPDHEDHDVARDGGHYVVRYVAAHDTDRDAVDHYVVLGVVVGVGLGELVIRVGRG